MKNLLYLSVVALVFVACGDEPKKDPISDADKSYVTEVPSADVLREGIEMLEDSIMRMSQSQEDVRKQLPNLTRQALIEKALLLYRSYPGDKDAAACLDKVHMTYSAMNAYTLAAKYADTLIVKYPKYEHRARVIESVASHYDYFVKPWDAEKVKSYYELLLKDYPNLTEEKKADVQFRLDNMDLTLEELMAKQ
ncbi:MAG: hypothetical protein P8M19_07370 [Crocinitomicaceae bacterium]|nr:hypothetical protein [Crocinitomicaceae bacterium]